MASSILLLGVVIYWAYRPAILMFDHPVIQSFRTKTFPLQTAMGGFAANYLADLCWAVYVNLAAWWMMKLAYPKFYSYFLLALPFVSELLQLLPFIPGTFDIADLLIYTVTFFIIYLINSKQCKQENISPASLSS